MKNLLFQIYVALRYSYPKEEAISIFDELLKSLFS